MRICELYMKDISKFPKLPLEESNMLFQLMHNGCQDSRDKLVHHNLRLVVIISQDHCKKFNGLDPMILVSLGNEALIKAVDSFKMGGAKFSTYAGTCIRNKIYLHSRKLFAWVDVEEFEEKGSKVRDNYLDDIRHIKNFDLLDKTYGLEDEKITMILASKQRGFSSERGRQLRNEALMEARLILRG